MPRVLLQLLVRTDATTSITLERHLEMPAPPTVGLTIELSGSGDWAPGEVVEVTSVTYDAEGEIYRTGVILPDTSNCVDPEELERDPLPGWVPVLTRR
jgi:hypothetical protein